MTNIATEISPETIKSMVEVVNKHLVDTHGVCKGLEPYLVEEEGPTIAIVELTQHLKAYTGSL